MRSNNDADDDDDVTHILWPRLLMCVYTINNFVFISCFCFMLRSIVACIEKSPCARVAYVRLRACVCLNEYFLVHRSTPHVARIDEVSTE